MKKAASFKLQVASFKEKDEKSFKLQAASCKEINEKKKFPIKHPLEACSLKLATQTRRKE
jgi:hypothetical protein